MRRSQGSLEEVGQVLGHVGQVGLGKAKGKRGLLRPEEEHSARKSAQNLGKAELKA